MKAADWKRLTKPVLSDEGWRLSKNLAYRVPVGWVLHGLLAEESSANHPDFYLWIVRIPLVVPTDVIDLSWSERFGDSSRVFEPEGTATEEAVRSAAKLVVEQATARELLVDPPGGADNVRMQEARAYGLLLKNSLDGASEVLGRVMRYRARYPWEHDLVQRAGEMRSLVAGGQAAEAVRRLEVWRTESLAAMEIVQ